MSIKSSLFVFSLILLASSSALWGQSEELVSEAKNNRFARLILTPYFNPYVPVRNDLMDGAGRSPYDLSSTGFEAGMMAEKYSPLRRVGLGGSLGLVSRRTHFKDRALPDLSYSVDANALALTPHVWLRAGGLLSPRKFLLRLGVSGRFLLYNTIRYNETLSAGVTRNIANREREPLNPFALYGRAELGISRTTMPFLEMRNRVSELSLGVEFALFNQADPFSSDASRFDPSLAPLTALRRKDVNFTLRSVQFINGGKSIKEIDRRVKQDLDKRWKGTSALFPPVQHYTPPHRRVEGAFNMGLVLQPAIDSVNVGTDTIFGQLNGGAHWTVGYTLHFLSLHRSRYLNQPGEKKRVTDIINARASPVTLNFFAGVNATRRFQRITLPGRYVNVEQWEFGAEGGIRIGAPLVMLVAGAGYYLRPDGLLKVYGADATGFYYSQPEDSLYYFAGVQLFGNVLLRVRYTDSFVSTKVNQVGADRLSFRVGVGF